MKRKFLLSCTLLLALASCHEKFEEPNLKQPESCNCKAEQAFPGKNGEIAHVKMPDGTTLTYEKINGKNIFEGDIILSEETLRALESKGMASENGKVSSAPGSIARRWTNSTVNFRISVTSRRADILWAINHIETNTNIRFIESATGSYIDFVESTGCSSEVGMQGNRQAINLASGCGRGSIVHEICHALGVFHEQSRPDRLSNIIILWDNIESGKSHNFETALAHNYSTFDFGSIMLYDSWAFSADNFSPTITRLDGSTFSSQRSALSTNDINALRDMYAGPERIKSISGAIDVGGNNNGDVVYSKRNLRFVEFYKNGVKVGSTITTDDIYVDVAADGTILKSGGTFYSGSGKYALHRIVDISEGGGNIYCLASNSISTGLFRKSGGNWTKVTGGGDRLTVDASGRIWLVNGNKITVVEGSTTRTIGLPVNYTSFDEFYDIGSSGDEIYASIKNLKSNVTQLVKYSTVTNGFIRQSGGASRLDGGNGIMYRTGG